jgi:hypothetical protein
MIASQKAHPERSENTSGFNAPHSGNAQKTKDKRQNGIPCQAVKDILPFQCDFVVDLHFQGFCPGLGYVALSERVWTL